MKKILYVLLASFTVLLAGCSQNELSNDYSIEDKVVSEDPAASFSMTKSDKNVYTLSVTSDRLKGVNEGRIKFNVLFYDSNKNLICETFVDKAGWGYEIFPECLLSQNADSNKNKVSDNTVTIKIPNKSFNERISDATSYEVVIDSKGSEYYGILTSGNISISN